MSKSLFARFEVRTRQVQILAAQGIIVSCLPESNVVTVFTPHTQKSVMMNIDAWNVFAAPEYQIPTPDEWKVFLLSLEGAP